MSNGTAVLDLLKNFARQGGKVARRQLVRWSPLLLMGSPQVQKTVKGLAKTMERRAVARARKRPPSKGAWRPVDYTLYGANFVALAATQGVFELAAKALEFEDVLTDFVLGDELEALTDVPEEAIRKGIIGLGEAITAFGQAAQAARKERLR